MLFHISLGLRYQLVGGAQVAVLKREAAWRAGIPPRELAPGGTGIGKDRSMSSQTPIRAVLFDADGVIQWPREGWLDRFDEIGGLGFLAEAFAAEQTTITGEGDFRELLNEVLAARGRPGRADEVLENWYDIVPDRDALALVDRLREAGFVTALATNQQSYRGAHMQRSYGYADHFDHSFYSFEMGLAKPDPAYFRHIADALGLRPEELFMIDDMPANVAGAQAAGLSAAVHQMLEVDISDLIHRPTPALVARAAEGFDRLAAGRLDNAGRLATLLRSHGVIGEDF